MRATQDTHGHTFLKKLFLFVVPGGSLSTKKQMRLDQKSELESFPEGHILTRIPKQAHGGRAPAGITAKMEFNVRGKKSFHLTFLS